MVPVNFQSPRNTVLHGQFFQPQTRGGDRGRYYLQQEGERKIFCRYIFQGEYPSLLWFLLILNSKVIQQYQIELFGTELDLSDTSQQRGRQTRLKHYKSKLKPQSKKQLHVSEVTSSCFILSFQGLEDSKGFIYERYHFNDYSIILQLRCTNYIGGVPVLIKNPLSCHPLQET